MNDEIKEINIPKNVLVALGDLTNGALNYYKATETVKVKYNTILDYITNLQKRLDRIEKVNCKLRKENYILKENAINNDKVVDKAKWNEMIYKSRNEKATEEIKRVLNIWETKPNEIATLDLEYLLNILQGEDKEIKERFDLVCKISEERKNKWLSLNEENDDIVKIIKDYKSRNEKAIEYIVNNDELYYGDDLYDSYQIIINILKGETHIDTK